LWCTSTKEEIASSSCLLIIRSTWRNFSSDSSRRYLREFAKDVLQAQHVSHIRAVQAHRYEVVMEKTVADQEESEDKIPFVPKGANLEAARAAHPVACEAFTKMLPRTSSADGCTRAIRRGSKLVAGNLSSARPYLFRSSCLASASHQEHASFDRVSGIP